MCCGARFDAKTRNGATRKAVAARAHEPITLALLEDGALRSMKLSLHEHLTERGMNRNNQGSMRIRGAVIRTLALAITMTVSWSVWLACAEGVIATPSAQMACCKDGELTCAAHGNANDCCLTDAARPHEAI